MSLREHSKPILCCSSLMLLCKFMYSSLIRPKCDFVAMLFGLVGLSMLFEFIFVSILMFPFIFVSDSNGFVDDCFCFTFAFTERKMK